MSIKIGSNDIKIMCEKIYVGTDEVYSSAPALTKRQTIEALVNKAHEENYPTIKSFYYLKKLIESSYWINNIGNIPIENYDNVVLKCAFADDTRPIGRIWLYLQNNDITYSVTSNTNINLNPYFATANGLRQFSWLYSETNVSRYYGEDTASTIDRTSNPSRRRFLYYWNN